MQDIRIIYKDKELLVCEKPVGISSESPGLPDILRHKIHSVCYPVHRLDIGTGGVCVQALNKKACSDLQQLFQAGKVSKEYLAVISGMPETFSGEYRDYLFHDTHRNKTYVVKTLRKGSKEAFCSWKVVETVKKENQTLSLVRVFLKTGRTHQIRVQFASRGFPLVGDRRYGSRIKSDITALWSNRICFQHPDNPEQIIDAVCAPPAVFPWILFQSVKQSVIRHSSGALS